MPISTIDPAAALIIVDLQKGVAGLPTVHPIAGVVENTNALAAAFRASGRLVVIVTVAGSAPGRTEAPRPGGERPADWVDVIPELDARADDIAVVKRTWGAFTGTALDAELRDRGVTQVVVTGVATSAGVESTARHAHELGYHVVLATDAMTDRDPVMHEHSISRVFPRIGETGTTAEILTLLDAGD
jgi:Amidases related to nicotinamidase